MATIRSGHCRSAFRDDDGGIIAAILPGTPDSVLGAAIVLTNMNAHVHFL